jgi:hypothetical protein
MACSVSCLSFDFTNTPLKHLPAVWLPIGERDWRPRVDYPPLHIAGLSSAALESGIEKYLVEGVTIPLISPANTVADCFKFRFRCDCEFFSFVLVFAHKKQPFSTNSLSC